MWYQLRLVATCVAMQVELPGNAGAPIGMRPADLITRTTSIEQLQQLVEQLDRNAELYRKLDSLNAIDICSLCLVLASMKRDETALLNRVVLRAQSLVMDLNCQGVSNMLFSLGKLRRSDSSAAHQSLIRQGPGAR